MRTSFKVFVTDRRTDGQRDGQTDEWDLMSPRFRESGGQKSLDTFSILLHIYVAIHFTLFSTAYIVYIVFSCGTCHLYVGKIYVNVLFVFCIKVPSATWHFTTGTFSHICVICVLHKGAICHMALYNTEIFSFLCSAERCHLHNCKYLINYQVQIIDPTIYDIDWCEVHLSKKAAFNLKNWIFHDGPNL